MGKFDDPLKVEWIDGKRWRVVEEFHYQPNGVKVTVPVGFETDFASIPRLLWPLLPPAGRYGKAAVIHDYLYQFPTYRSRGYCDRIFRQAMADLGVGWVTRTIIYLGVRLGGWVTWDVRQILDTLK